MKTRFETTTIGRIINPSWSYDLEQSVRLLLELIDRSKAGCWRFKGQYVTTGPYETMAGYPGCGSGHSEYSSLGLDLPVALGHENMTKAINGNIMRALCSYPGFAELSEEMRMPPRSANCMAGVFALAALNGRKTLRPLNPYHKNARKIGNVRIVCDWQGVHVDADIMLSRSSWGVFYLLREEPPKWNRVGRLAKWLDACCDRLIGIIEAEVVS